MTERYDERAASHYAAYRPPLHRLILRRVVSGSARCGAGLDVGCGTGYSALALAEFCDRVYGIDPSASMLARAAADPKVTYLRAAADRIPLPDASIDIVTFAGSLFYADGDRTRAEVRRVCPSGIVIAYDFEVLLGDVLCRLGLDVQAAASGYNHRANFSGAEGFTEIAVASERITLEMTPGELAHVLLSDTNRLDRFARKFREADPFQTLVAQLAALGQRPTIEADIYYSKYQVR